MSTDLATEFVPLNGFEDSYEILNQYPFTIRNKIDGKIVSEYFHNDYIQVFLNKKTYLKHRLIALQFIPNPNNLPQVDHLNHNRNDNRIENLRWVSSSTNQLNKSSNRGVVYEFVDDIPEEAIKVNSYGGHDFENYYYYDNIFYLYNGMQYRKLHVNENKRGFKIVNMLDINGNKVRVYYSKFKKLYDLE
ncbi:hypothetical protein M9Y10_011582 [Tritrichomonas musculus]|uniref:HNH nuclease domain-containing protein n=1 Tax=Tritrichomonas musculus TaxID=1915356 RepID=A0ABR2IJP1_9EUKA